MNELFGGANMLAYTGHQKPQLSGSKVLAYT